MPEWLDAVLGRLLITVASAKRRRRGRLEIKPMNIDVPNLQLSQSDRFHTINVKDKQGKYNNFTVPWRYTDLQYLSAGAQGTVVSAYDLKSGQRVAIKKMQQPFVAPISAKRAYREFVLLASIKHPNIIRMCSAFTPQSNKQHFSEVYLVMELMNHCLHEVIHRLKLDHKTLSFFVYQLLCAVNHLHRTGIIHRDLKPTNIVVNDQCVLKVLDFGLARKTIDDPAHRMTEFVCTRWYRAPEVILGMKYTEKVDVWSIGCIFAEMINRRVLFQGNDQMDQWLRIYTAMGTPSEEFMSRLHTNAADFVRKQPYAEPQSIAKLVPSKNFYTETENFEAHLTAWEAQDLLSKMLEMDADKRCTIKEALKHNYVKCWFAEAEVNMPASESRYQQELDFVDYSLDAWKDLIFDEVKRFERDCDVFGDTNPRSS